MRTVTCLACGHEMLYEPPPGVSMCDRRYLSPHCGEFMAMVAEELRAMGRGGERVKREELTKAQGVALEKWEQKKVESGLKAAGRAEAVVIVERMIEKAELNLAASVAAGDVQFNSARSYAIALQDVRKALLGNND